MKKLFFAIFFLFNEQRQDILVQCKYPMTSFKKTYTFEERKREASNIKKKYPNRLPVIVENNSTASMPAIDKHKYLVPAELTMGAFLTIIRKRLELSPEKGLFVSITDKQVLPCNTSLMSQIYKEHSEPCGYLYLTLSSETTFGTLFYTFKEESNCLENNRSNSCL
jgi:GABA(A) receptor-associated protein